MTKPKNDPKPDNTSPRQDEVRTRIIKAAIQLLKDGGREALTTRAVCDASEVQAPTIYRLFGDMRGLTNAVTEFGLHQNLKKKKEQIATDDPVEDLRNLWEQHTAFGLQNPVIYSLIFGDLNIGFQSPAAIESKQLLARLIHRIAVSGRLKVSEQRATELVYAASSGAVLSLLKMTPDERDLSLANDACESVISFITSDAPRSKKLGKKSAAVTLQASLSEITLLTPGEKLLLKELLERISADKESE